MHKTPSKSRQDFTQKALASFEKLIGGPLVVEKRKTKAAKRKAGKRAGR